MNKLLFGNVDYRTHTTSEGDEFQRGLEAAGWTVVGHGFLDHCRDAKELIARYRPEIVIVHDKRDWDPASDASFRKDIGFKHLDALAAHPEIFKLAVIKDAGSSIDYHRQFAEEIAANALVTYYHDRSVIRVASWMADYLLIRTTHSVDRSVLDKLSLKHNRRRGIATGALSDTYPLRQLAFENVAKLRIEKLRHPGYSNQHTFTPEYLRRLSNYRVHVATASRYRFLLRKIIESIAVGTTPVTNLPDYDVLPHGLDRALVRVSENATLDELCNAIDVADRNWNAVERLDYARRATEYFDFRAVGLRLSHAIERAHAERSVAIR